MIAEACITCKKIIKQFLFAQWNDLNTHTHTHIFFYNEKNPRVVTCKIIEANKA